MKIRSFLSVFLALAGGVAAGQDQLPAPAAPAAGAQEGRSLESFKEQVSYCLGINFGRQLRADDIPIDFAAVAAGLRDGVTAADPLLTDQQIAAVMQRFRQQLEQKLANKVPPGMEKIAEENLAKGEKFLAENATKEGVQTTESGLQYRVIEEGSGSSPGPRDTVRCHYEGTLIGGEVFDSSYKRGTPATFPVNRVIAGWTEALQLMKVGAKWEVFLPPGIAYGPRGSAPVIGPNETLIFQIELLGIE